MVREERADKDRDDLYCEVVLRDTEVGKGNNGINVAICLDIYNYIKMDITKYILISNVVVYVWYN